nr:MAG TPA: dUTPase [Caudoviricetes sp.]
MKFCKIRDVKSPCRGHATDAGIDFFVPNDFSATVLPPHQSINIPSGIKASIPAGHALIAFNKSGVALKKGFDVGASVVDESYQGEIHLHLTNTSEHYINVEPGEKIVQFILLPVNYEMPEEVAEDDLFESKSERGEGGFGSTGVA